MTLDDYFHVINQPKKETTMMLKLSMWFTEQLEKIKNLWTKPVAFVEQEVLDDDYWAFEMVTNEWIDENGETRPIKHTYIIEPHETTWMEVLDRIMDEMEKHYGYSIKDQVYYSVQFPLNDINPFTGKPIAGYGRSLNDEVLQQLLLAFPEVYTTGYFNGPSKEVFK
jgi:hypothetical protein